MTMYDRKPPLGPMAFCALVAAAPCLSATSGAHAMGGPVVPAPAQPEQFCTDRDGDGFYDPTECKEFYADSFGPNEVADDAFVVYRRASLSQPDNCPQDKNPKQQDKDGDGVGDMCEYVNLTSGANHTCGLRSDGSVSCWGDNSYGQSDAPLFNFTAIAAGKNHTCGLLNSGDPAKKGRVYCWGDPARNITAGVNGQFDAIRAHGNRTCAFAYGGAAQCWGDIGSSTLIESNFLVDIAPAFDVAPPGSDTPAYGYCAARNSPFGIQCNVGGPPPSVPESGVLFLALDGGDRYLCGIQVGGTATCWRKFTEEPPTSPEPVLTPAMPNQYSWISVGLDHACATGMHDRQVRCWGSNEFGKSTPPPGRFEEVSVGDNHSCAKAENGRIVCWGDSGVSSRDPAASRSNKLLPRRSLYTEVSANEYMACGLRDDRKLVCADMATNNIPVPPGDYDEVFVSEGTICARRGPGNLVCFDPETLEVEELPQTFAFASRREIGSNVASKYQCIIREDSRNVACRVRGEPVFDDFNALMLTRFRQIGLMSTNSFCGLTEDGSWICADPALQSAYYQPRSYERFDSLSCSSGKCCVVNADHTYCVAQSGTLVTLADPRTTCERLEIHIPSGTYSRDICLDSNRCETTGRLNCATRTEPCLPKKVQVGPTAVNYCPANQPAWPRRETISIGSQHGCTLNADTKQPICWGANAALSSYFQPSEGTFSSLASGTNFTCGLNIDGEPKCWGQMKEEIAGVRRKKNLGAYEATTLNLDTTRSLSP